MKKIGIILVFLLVTCSCSFATKPYNVFNLRVEDIISGKEQVFGPVKEILVERTYSPPKLDGINSDDCWNIPIYKGRYFLESNSQEQEYITYVQVTYDKNYVYVFMFGYYGEDMPLIKADMPYRINGNGVRYDSTLGVTFKAGSIDDPTSWWVSNLNGAKMTNLVSGHISIGTDEDWEVKTALLNDGWAMEARIPWFQLPVGDKYIINFTRRITSQDDLGDWKDCNDKSYGCIFSATGEKSQVFSGLSLTMSADEDTSELDLSGFIQAFYRRSSLSAEFLSDDSIIENKMPLSDVERGGQPTGDTRTLLSRGSFLGPSTFYPRSIGDNIDAILSAQTRTQADSLYVLAVLGEEEKDGIFCFKTRQLGNNLGLAVLHRKDASGISNSVFYFDAGRSQPFWDGFLYEPTLEAAVAGDERGKRISLENYLRHRTRVFGGMLMLHTWLQADGLYIEEDYKDNPFAWIRDYDVYSLDVTLGESIYPLRAFFLPLDPFRKLVFQANIERKNRLNGDFDSQSISSKIGGKTKNYGFYLGCEQGKIFEDDIIKRDSLVSLDLELGTSRQFQNLNLSYTFGEQGDESLSFIQADSTVSLFGLISTLDVRVRNKDIIEGLISLRYLLPRNTDLMGRIYSWKKGDEYGTNAYLGVIIRSGNTNIYIIAGSPNADKFEEKVSLKVQRKL